MRYLSCVAPGGASCRVHAAPGFPPWAKLCRPYGASAGCMRSQGSRHEGQKPTRTKRRVGHPKNRCWQDALRDSLRQAPFGKLPSASSGQAGQAGQAIRSSGQALRPSGQALRPSGQALRPSGQALRSSGQALRSSGQALRPSGQAGATKSPREIPRPSKKKAGARLLLPREFLAPEGRAPRQARNDSAV